MLGIFYFKELINIRRLIIGDTHFEHPKLVEVCGRPKNSDTVVANNWAGKAQDDDISIHLGDVTFGDRHSLKRILDKIRGKKYLVRGNHDRLTDSQYLWAGFDGVFNELVMNHVLYTHEPVFIYGGRVDINVHGHLHNLGYDHHSAFGGSYMALNDGKHMLYAPELFNYRPMEVGNLFRYYEGEVK